MKSLDSQIGVKLEGAGKCLIAAPHLLRHGLIVNSASGKPESYALSLLQSGQIDRATFGDLGFMLFQNQTEGFVDESEIPYYSPQFPHLDYDYHGGPMVTRGVLSLRYPEQKARRKAKTAVVDRKQACERLVKFLAENMLRENAPWTLKGLQHEIGIHGEEVILSDFQNGSENWQIEIFAPLFTSIDAETAYHNSDLLTALYAELADITYVHSWEPNQLLLVDNTQMLHWRMADMTQAPDEGKLMQNWLLWDQNGTNLHQHRQDPEELDAVNKILKKYGLKAKKI